MSLFPEIEQTDNKKNKNPHHVILSFPVDLKQPSLACRVTQCRDPLGFFPRWFHEPGGVGKIDRNGPIKCGKIWRMHKQKQKNVLGDRSSIIHSLIYAFFDGSYCMMLDTVCFSGSGLVFSMHLRVSACSRLSDPAKV